MIGMRTLGHPDQTGDDEAAWPFHAKREPIASRLEPIPLETSDLAGTRARAIRCGALVTSRGQ